MQTLGEGEGSKPIFSWPEIALNAEKWSERGRENARGEKLAVRSSHPANLCSKLPPGRFTLKLIAKMTVSDSCCRNFPCVFEKKYQVALAASLSSIGVVRSS